ncbi:hypothetical protein DSO57_1016217 [Entomophthora muscae]|uniref:Uncharacterized protein n=1 Tax=Entomophthora muscae TaxID=34485 RepID=A0ACC2UQV8_9FUNG|nr:hypothetical protein DSO57_1016217 [Entomophthora muscae]
MMEPTVTLPFTLQPNRPMDLLFATETISTQLFRVLFITFLGMVDTMVPNSGPWSLLEQSLSYIIKLEPILWWALPNGLAVPFPESPNTSAYAWLPDIYLQCLSPLSATTLSFLLHCGLPSREDFIHGQYQAVYLPGENLVSLEGVKNEKLLPLENQAKEQDSNPNFIPLQAAGPKAQGATGLGFAMVEPLQAKDKSNCLNNEASQTQATNLPNKGLIKAPNGGNKTPTISFMRFKAMPVANEELILGRGTGLWPDPMTATIGPENQVINLRILANERTPGLGAIIFP